MASSSSRKMTETVIQLRKSLATAVAGSRTEEVKSILKQLRTEVVATEAIIRDTKIGLSVGKLRKNPNKEVADMAKEIVKKWKNDFGPVRSANVKGESASTPGEPVTPSTPASALSPDGLTPSIAAAPKLLANNSLESVKPATTTTVKRTTPRTAKTDNVKFNFTDDSSRDKCMSLIYDALASDSEADIKEILQRSKEVEAQVHISTSSNTANYTKKMRSLYLNLKDKHNPRLREMVISGTLLAERLVKMTPQEMASEERRREDEKIAEENLFKARAADEAVSGTITEEYQCFRCKNRKTTYRQMQTRSADEPMTTFVTCLVCQNVWKF